MNQSKSGIAVSILIICLGIAWLLNTMNVLPGIDWIYTMLLGIAGVLVLALGGVNKLTFVVGPILIIASIFSILRQTGKMSINIEMPLLFTLVGILMLLSYLLNIKSPDLRFTDDKEQTP